MAPIADQLLSSALAGCVVIFCAGCNCSFVPGEQQRMLQEEREIFYRIATAELERIDIPYQDREWTIEYSEEAATVRFLPPHGARAGEFIIRINRASKAVEDVVIWR